VRNPPSLAIVDDYIIESTIKERPIMPIRTLVEAISHYGHDAYLLTVAQDGPHVGQVTIELRDGSIGCALGPSAARNIAGEPKVSLFWPPVEPDGYALIVNGMAAGERQATGVIMADITLTKSVPHRSGLSPEASDGPCKSDCRRLTW
jgi:hypothetical protein